MVTITLAKPWTFRSPEKTIEFAAGEHEVAKYIADAAIAAGATEDPKNGSTGKTAAGSAKGAAGTGKG